jgi:hypothetical protein
MLKLPYKIYSPGRKASGVCVPLCYNMPLKQSRDDPYREASALSWTGHPECGSDGDEYDDDYINREKP